MLLTEQKERDHYTAQYTIVYTKQSDNPKPVPPYYLGGHRDVWYYHQEADGRWVAGQKDVDR